jgi:hypothetical protein
MIDLFDNKKEVIQIQSKMSAQETEIRSTVTYDPRFPNQNQTRACWQNYVDYHRCINLKGEDYKPCQVSWTCLLHGLFNLSKSLAVLLQELQDLVPVGLGGQVG